MKLNIALTAIAIAAAQTAVADSRINELCGEGHVNEAASATDIQANPDGYFVVSLQEQVTFGDPRLMHSNEDSAYVCTRSKAIPNMDWTNFEANKEKRAVSWLFVPNIGR